MDRCLVLPLLIPICFEGDCYIKLENNGKSWTDAQQMCKKYNATLPVVDNPDRQRSLVAALYYFRLNGTADAWLGANASDYGAQNWRWLDGSQYSATANEGAGTYSKGYAFLSKRASKILAYASTPYDSHSYICQYNTITKDVCTNGTGRLAFLMGSQCFVKYDKKLSWFNARSNCLANNSELASFSNVSLLGGIVDTNGSWVGLRHSEWNWQNAVTGSSSDVTFTSWSSNQPDDATPTCISIDHWEFPNWRDWNCSLESQYICQVVNTTTTEWTQVTHSSELSTPFSTTGNVSIGKPASQSEVNVPLAIGLGVGLGAALITVILIIITVIVVRRKHRNRESIKDSKSREKFEIQNGGISPEEETTELNEISHDRKSPLDEDTSPNYATVMETRDLEPNSHASSIIQSQLDDASPNYATVLETSHLETNTQHATTTTTSQLNDTLPSYAIVQKVREFVPNFHQTPSSISQSQLDNSYYATVQEANDLEPNSQHGITTSQSQLDGTFPNYAIVERASDLEPDSQQTATNNSQSELDDALPVYGIVHKARDIEPISQEITSINSQPHLDGAPSNYGVVRKARDLEQNSQHSATTSESHMDDESPYNATTVQETRDLEPICLDATSNNSQSQLDYPSPNYATIQENNDLEPIAEDTTSLSQLDEASHNYASIQEVIDFVPSSQQTTTNTNESQLDDISPLYAMIQVAEGLTQDSEPTVNQNPVYADLDFCQEGS